MIDTSQYHKELYAKLNWANDSKIIPDPRLEHLKYCLSQVSIEGQYLEFGVFQGYTINYIAEQVPDKIVYGFDSFYGIPNDWLWMQRGQFSTGGVLPTVRNNVKLVPGWFDETIPNFDKQPVAFMHIDCDLYESTKYVLDTFADYIVPGTIIAFDDFPYFPSTEQHEYRAFIEFVDRTNKSYMVLSQVSATPYTSIVFT